MNLTRFVLLTALLVARAHASSLTFTLNPVQESGAPAPYTNAVSFIGTLTDTDTADTCDSENLDCLYLNFITYSFDQPASATHLSGDSEDFYLYVPQVLSDDGVYNSYSGPVFSIDIAPNTPLGVYTGEVSIYGGYDSAGADNLLAEQNFTVVASPEPAALGLALAGFAAIFTARRRVPA